MTPVILHPFVFYFLLGGELLFMGTACYFCILWAKRYWSDAVLMVDKSNRWEIIYTSLKDKVSYFHLNKSYPLVKSLLNRRGKALFVFSEDNPAGMDISYNKGKWLDAESLKTAVNNDLIKKLIKPSSSLFDFLIICGAIGGIIAGLAATIHLLIATGVIHAGA